MIFKVVREWRHSERNKRMLLKGMREDFYLLSWVYHPVSGNQTLIVCAKEDGEAIEWGGVVEGTTPTDALAKFRALPYEELIARLERSMDLD